MLSLLQATLYTKEKGKKQMNKHERNIELMYGLTVWLGWLTVYAISWLVGLGLGFILFY